ncbi:MAG: hypothetical protein Q4A20_05950 [Actinomyces sp.]|nr:hypothetical protein [Actinomyces sp.]
MPLKEQLFFCAEGQMEERYVRAPLQYRYEGAFVPRPSALSGGHGRQVPGAGLLPVCPINELEVVITTAAPGTASLPDLAGTATEALFA